MNLILTQLNRLFRSCLGMLRSCFARWTKPLTTSLLLETLADLNRSKSELIAENALLRQQLIILRRQVKRPTFTRADRMLLVLLARTVQYWKQALFIIQPETLLGGIVKHFACFGSTSHRSMRHTQGYPLGS